MMTVVMTSEELLCPECGYDLRGIESGRCPECGQELDREKLRRSSIPWSYRGEIGYWKAYWRTVALVIRRPAQVASEMARLVSFDDARRFRRVTVTIAAIVPIALLLWLYGQSLSGPRGAFALGSIFGQRAMDPDPPLPSMYALGWVLEFTLVAVMCAAVPVFLFAASGVVSYFFHPSFLPMPRQNRAVALSYYACAPLAMTPLTATMLTLLAVAKSYQWFLKQSLVLPLSVLAAVAIMALLIQAIATFTAPLRMLVRTTRCSAARVLTMAVMLPLLWTILGTLILIGIPAAFAFLAIVLLSFAP